MDKKPLIIIITSVLIAVGLSGCTEQTSETGEKHEAGYFTYENTQDGFKINYPDSWMKQENYVPDIVVVFSIEPGMTGMLNCSLRD